MSLFNLALRTMFQFSLRTKVNKPKQTPFKHWQITRGDKVKIRAGDDKGKVARVLRVFKASNKVIVNGINKKIKNRSTCYDIKETMVEK